VYFNFCPSCGHKDPEFVNNRHWQCQSCGFDYYHNVTIGVGVFLSHRGKYLFIKRGQEPSKGLLGIPGGFADPGESAEDTARREAKEEVGLDVINLRYLGSSPNFYDYKGIGYATCDFYFTGEIAGDPLSLTLEKGEVEDAVWLAKGEIVLDDLAFPSLKSIVTAKILTQET
jgi:NADH pyrophosphatase NudC (nudix superfamily)